MPDWEVKFEVPHATQKLHEELGLVAQLVIEDLADLAYVTIVETLEQQKNAFPPLSAVTQWFRQKQGKSTRTRIDTGDFLRGIQQEIRDKYALVGMLVPRNSKGDDMEMIAKIMEGGATIRVTSKMRRWFAAQGKPLRKSTMFLHIPPRPVFAAAEAEIDAEVDKVVGKYLDQMLAKV